MRYGRARAGRDRELALGAELLAPAISGETSMRLASLPSCSVRCLIALAAVACAGPALAQDEWPGFRGRTGAGVASVSLDVDTLNPAVAWRVPAGIGYSGVTVVDGKAITMFEEGDQVMVAYDAESGTELWRTRVADPYPGRDGSWNGPIATPVAAGGLVVGLEPWGRLFALQVDSGEDAWSLHLADDLGAPRPVYGFGSNPLIVGDTVVVHGGPGAGALLGIDLATGEVRWTVGDEVVDAQSPVALTLAGSNMVVAAGSATVFGIEASTGAVVWEYEHGGDGYRGQGSLMPVGLADDQIFLAHSDNASQVIKVVAEGEEMSAEQIWMDRVIRNSYTVAVHHEGYIYAYSARILMCVDAATGEMQWRSRQPGDGFLTLIGDNMVILTKDGSVHVAKATPEGYEERASAVVFSDLTWSPPSVAYGDLFARSLDEVVRIDLNAADTAIADASNVNFNVPRSVEPGSGAFGTFVSALATSPAPGSAIEEFLATNPESPIVENDVAHFFYVGPEATMAIQADFIGSRQEAPMVRVGDTEFFYYSAELLPDSRTSYAFASDTATFPDPRNPLVTQVLIVDADREFNFGGPPIENSDFRMPEWELPSHLREPAAGSSRGTLETITVPIEGVGEFPYQVYLPVGYGDSDARYPVVYYQGQTPADLSQVPLSLDNLIADGMQPVIAVFSEVFVPPGPFYSGMWAETLVPMVDESYRTIASGAGRVAVGAGLGSVVATFIAFEHPEMTSGLATQSFFFLTSDWDQLTPLLKPASERPLRMYMDWGVYGVQNPQEAWDLRADSVLRWEAFEELGFELQGGEANDGSGWAAWRNRNDAALKAILPTSQE